MEIIKLRSSQTRDENALKALNEITIDINNYKNRKQELNSNLERRQKELENLLQKKQDIEDGLYDEEIQETERKNRIAIEKKNKVAKEKKNIDIVEKEENKKNLETRFKNDKEEASESEMRYQYKRFMSISDTIPDYMIENLKDMPNNKGYLWRGCSFWGKRAPERNQPIILFEKLRGGIMRIHETTDTEKRIYEKKGKEKKRYISGRRRILINF